MRRAALLALLTLPSLSLAQDRLPLYPGYEAYRKALSERGAGISTLRRAVWDEGSASWTARGDDDKWTRFDPRTKSFVPSDAPKPRAGAGGRGSAPGRGRQYTESVSPTDGWKAVYRDRNVVLVSPDGKTETPITTDGSAATRIKYGTASWVYGEELDQREAIWFSPDGRKVAFYRFDESKIPDYYVLLGEGKIQNELAVEAYPKAGAPNPVVDLLVYDRDTKTTTRVDVRAGAKDGDGSGDDLGHYVYEIAWTGPGTLRLFRMNRLQNALDICTADAATGALKVVRTERNPGGWTDYKPFNLYNGFGAALTPLGGGRSLWLSEANGYRNLVAISLDGSAPATPITRGLFEVFRVVRVDDKRKEIWYEARSAPGHPYWMQLHRVGFDGTGDVRLTDPSIGHSVVVAGDGSGFADTAEAFDAAPKATLRDRDGKALADLGAVSEKAHAVRFSCLAADGKTEIHGYYKLPSDYDPKKTYPLILDVYGGPESGTVREGFEDADPRTALGFVTAWVDGRGTAGRGRAFRQSVYRRLGGPEIDDQAAFVKALVAKGVVDPKRVGIVGTSYGGYASVLALLRYPEVFRCAVSGSPVTDWRNYDSTYTERYMGLPQENAKGYDLGSAMTYAKSLRGDLMLYFGTADDNVHPSNVYQLARALDRAGKRYDLSVGTDRGHSGPMRERELEYLVESLILDRGAARRP